MAIRPMINIHAHAILLKNKRNAVLFTAFLLFSALGATRTRDPLLRKQVLYPLSYESLQTANGKAVLVCLGVCKN